MHRIYSLAFVGILGLLPMPGQDNILGPSFRWQHGHPGKVLEPVGPWELLGDDYQLTADPTVDKEGFVYFTNAKKNQILKIDLAGKISVWKEGSNDSHGAAIGPDGTLFACQHDLKRVAAFASGGTESVVAEGLQSHHLTVTSRNQIYLSGGPTRKIWLVDAASSKEKRVVDDSIHWPRAVRVSADQSHLAVNYPESRWVWLFDIQEGGSLANGRPYYRLESPNDISDIDPGGMAFDSEGYLYVATKFGVQMFDPRGRFLTMIQGPGSEGANNVLFGGIGLRWLYVTEWNKVYRLAVTRTGSGPWKR